MKPHLGIDARLPTALAALTVLSLHVPAALACGEGEGESGICGESCKAPRVEPTGLLQVWATAWDQDQQDQADPAGYGDPEDDMGFKVRRGRIGMEGQVTGSLDFAVVFGVASPYDTWKASNEDVGLVDGYLGYTRGGFRVSAGQQKAPYGREQLVSARQLVFTERAVSTEYLSPDRETGLVAGYAWKGLQVRAGAFNGSGSFLGNETTGMMFVGRAEYSVQPDLAYETWGKVDGLVLGVGANGLYNDDLSTRTVGFGGDLIVRVAGLALLVQADHQTLSPADTTAASPDVMVETPRMGGMAQVGYSLGAFEPAVRVSMFDDRVDADAKDAGDVMELYGGVTWHVADDFGRVGAGYVHRSEGGSWELPNDTIRLWTQVQF